ncbi:MAG: glycosyltransferase [Candidatus Aminicenantes bacterium]|nr:glycosyltransferase [Candidatus Aminicenantes bacterium]
MKVLISAYAFNPIGSMQLHPGEDLVGWKLVQQINKHHKVWVLTHGYNREAVLEEMAKGELEGVQVIFVNLTWLKKLLYKVGFGERIYYYIWQFAAWQKARQLHRRVGFDLAHQVTFGNDWIPSFIGAFLPVPFIWGPVGGGQTVPPELLKEFSFYGRFAEKSRVAAQWVGRRLWTRRRLVKRAEAILVCNQETKQKIPKKYHSKVHYFPVNGIDKKEIGPVPKKKENQEDFLVLTAGRLHRLKGFDLAVKAFHLFCQENQNTQFQIVGSGREKKNLESLIERSGLEYRVKIMPWVQRKELLNLMQKCDVFLFPSLRDGGGAVVVEAMAQGKPVVGLNIGGPGFHIKNKWGIKVEPRTKDMVANGLALALEKLYKDEPLRRKMGKTARKQAKEHYVWDELGKQMEKIYQSVNGESQAVNGQ